MPIGDLLAQISGGKPEGSPAPTLHRQNSAPVKRKASGDLGGDSKAARWSTPQTIATQPQAQRPTNGFSGTPRPTSAKPSPSAPKAYTGTGKVTRPSDSSAPPSAANAVRKAPPKKGSFAEILARGKLAQVSMGQVGKIQHKKVEKGAVKRDREEPTTAPRGSKGKQITGHAGTSKSLPQRSGVKSAGPVKSARDRRASGLAVNGQRPNSTKKFVEDETQKKVKKAAIATTGYTGTARPIRQPTRKDAPRGGALLSAPARQSSSKHSRYENDYDEELDDFIEYDDDDDGAPRYGYDSDGSSDMEAGLDDIDTEERRADYIARREDIEEEKMEKSRKMAKEERKRKALEDLRAQKRR